MRAWLRIVGCCALICGCGNPSPPGQVAPELLSDAYQPVSAGRSEIQPKPSGKPPVPLPALEPIRGHSYTACNPTDEEWSRIPGRLAAQALEHLRIRRTRVNHRSALRIDPSTAQPADIGNRFSFRHPGNSLAGRPAAATRGARALSLPGYRSGAARPCQRGTSANRRTF